MLVGSLAKKSDVMWSVLAWDEEVWTARAYLSEEVPLLTMVLVEAAVAHDVGAGQHFLVWESSVLLELAFGWFHLAN